MRVKSLTTLALFRLPGPCDYCGRWCLHPESAHLYAKGMGGAKRCDLPINIARLGSAFECGCHAENHAGRKPKLEDLLEKVAAREGCTPEEITQTIMAIRRLPRDAPMSAVLALIPKPRKSGRKA